MPARKGMDDNVTELADMSNVQLPCQFEHYEGIING